MRVFVSTCNNPLNGSWLNLSDYSSSEEFTSACESVVARYGAEEYMFPDIEPYISGIMPEHMCAVALWDFYVEYSKAVEEGNENAFLAYLNTLSTSEDATYDSFLDVFIGEYESGAAYAEQIAEECGELENVPDFIKYHIDWEAVWECELRFDYNYYEIDRDGSIYIFNN